MNLIELNNISQAAKALEQALTGHEPKYIRMGKAMAVGPLDILHADIAVRARLPIKTIMTNNDLTYYCDDAGKLQVEKNRITVFDQSSSVGYLTNDGMPIIIPENPDDILEAMRPLFDQLKFAHQVTCRLLVAVANVLPGNPEVFYTISNHPESAVLYQP